MQRVDQKTPSSTYSIVNQLMNRLVNSPKTAFFSVIQLHRGCTWKRFVSSLKLPTIPLDRITRQNYRFYSQNLGRPWGPPPDFPPGSEEDPTKPPPGFHPDKFAPTLNAQDSKEYRGIYFYMFLSGLALVGFNYWWYATQYEPAPIFVDSKYVKFELLDKKRINHDTFLLTFRHQLAKGASSDEALGLLMEWPVCSHISVKNTEMQIQRPYTPVSVTKDRIELLIKRYGDGFMTPWLVNRQIGDKIEMRGPFVSFFYAPNMKERITMIAGGTGITPMWQLIQRVLSNPIDKTKLTLVYCNKTLDDVLLRQELDDLASRFPDRLEVRYMVEKADKDWQGLVGRIDRDIISQVANPTAKSLVMVCGPDGMMNAVSGPLARDGSQGPVGGMLSTLGFQSSQVIKFA